MKLRKANLKDLEILVQLRLDYLTADQGPLTDADQTAIRAQLNRYIPAQMDHNFVAILAEINGEIAPTAFLAITERPANPSFLTGKTGTLLNVFTYSSFRRRGIPTQVLEAIIKEARTQNVSRIDLFATSAAIALYRKFGFRDPNNAYTAMQLNLK